MVVVGIICSIVTGLGISKFADESKPVVARSKVSMPEAAPPELAGDKATGVLKGGCPSACAQVKRAVGNYLIAFSKYGTVNLVLLIIETILMAATAMGWFLYTHITPAKKIRTHRCSQTHT